MGKVHCDKEIFHRINDRSIYLFSSIWPESRKAI